MSLTWMFSAGYAYLWTVAMDAKRLDIASEARDMLVLLHLDLSEDLQQHQASVRSMLIKCVARSSHNKNLAACCGARFVF